MDNETTKSDDEYHASEQDHEIFQSDSQPERKSDGGNRKKVFVILGILVLIFCLYKLYGLFSATPHASTTTTTTSSNINQTVPATISPQAAPAVIAPAGNANEQPAAVSTPVTTPTIPAAIAPPAQPIIQPTVVAPAVNNATVPVSATSTTTTNSTNTSSNSMTPSQVPPASTTPTAVEIAQNNRLDSLVQSTTQDHNAIQNMQNQVNALTTTITSLQGSIASLNSAINNLKTQAMQIQAPVIKPAIIIPKSIITTTYIPMPPRRHYYRPSPGAEYFVKAMIQGRAWLVDSQGATVTISSGDTLPGYGLIEQIDPSQGIVTTSSGAIIQYNPSDR